MIISTVSLEVERNWRVQNYGQVELFVYKCYIYIHTVINTLEYYTSMNYWIINGFRTGNRLFIDFVNYMLFACHVWTLV